MLDQTVIMFLLFCFGGQISKLTGKAEKSHLVAMCLTCPYCYEHLVDKKPVCNLEETIVEEEQLFMKARAQLQGFNAQRCAHRLRPFIVVMVQTLLLYARFLLESDAAMFFLVILLAFHRKLEY